MSRVTWSMPPRIMIAAPNGRSGKTIVSVGLCGMLRKKGIRVQPFKKGPDFIDASWLSAASGRPCPNLDAFMMSRESLCRNFESPAGDADFLLVEGNMGLYDGVGEEGEGSSAYLARLLKTPVILVINTTRMTRSVAALVRGYMDFEPATPVAGVILNNVSGVRHTAKLMDAIERYCKLPVVGTIPRNAALNVTERHLGLIPFRENETGAIMVERITKIVEKHLDVEEIVGIAGKAGLYETRRPETVRPVEKDIRIGVVLDRAFHFYYPENLAALEAEGAELIFVDSFSDRHLPLLDGLYIGGGFPELYLEELEKNEVFRKTITQRIEDGLPVYAECGGLMYLSTAVVRDGRSYEMAGLIPSEVEFCDRPQGHGYVEAEVRYENPFYPVGTKIRGHEFHHSRLKGTKALHCALAVKRGRGIDGAQDGIVYKNVFASYTHVHASGTRVWARGFAAAARRFGKEQKEQEECTAREAVHG